MTLHDVRRDYSGEALPDDLTGFDPWAFLQGWVDDALASDEAEPTAMVLSTVGLDGRPRARVLLAKEVGPEGIVFFTHTDSPKGEELAATASASAVFWWSTLMRQVRAVGSVSELSREESEAYFASRPRASQVGAWASHQSRPMASHSELKEAVDEAERRFDGVAEVPCPPQWGGYRMDVDELEFWQGQPSRLNDRVLARRTDEGWTATYLQP